MPTMYIISGPNGAGKTTAAKTILPEYYKIFQFVNADEIARGLSPFAPESVSFLAGKIMLKRLYELIDTMEDFGFETTLTTLAYKKIIRLAKDKGYSVKLLFLWLSSPDIAKLRVKKRVSEGGHNIPPDIIERRYLKGLKNLPDFLQLADEWLLINNSMGDYKWIAKKENQQTEIFNFKLWEKLKS